MGADGAKVDTSVGGTVSEEKTVGCWDADGVRSANCVNAMEVNVASMSITGVGVGMEVGNVHANTKTNKTLNQKNKTIRFFIRASFPMIHKQNFPVKR